MHSWLKKKGCRCGALAFLPVFRVRSLDMLSVFVVRASAGAAADCETSGLC